MNDEPKIKHRVVMASAGSGKTYQLTEHYLSLLRAHEKPASILATTFTRKSAGEILGRVLARLAESAKRDVGDRMILAQLCRGLHHVAISTMDSFFNRVAMGFRHELGIVRDAMVVAETDVLAAQLRGEAIDAMLADNDIAVLVDLMMRLHHDSAVRSVAGALDEVVCELHKVYREAPERELWDQLDVPGRKLSATELVDAIERLVGMADQLPRNKTGTPPLPNANWLKYWQKSIGFLHARDWEKFMGGGIQLKISRGESSYQRAEITDAWVDAYRPLIDHAMAELVGRVAEQTRATFDLLSRFDVHDRRLRRERGVMLFSDIPYKLAYELPMMGDGLWDQIYYRLDGQISHLLLDEFQDTSSLQWQILQPMADEMIARGDEFRTFFCVGDVKQAIYGWRGGVAEIFDQVKIDLHSLPESAWQRMNESYRSGQVVLDAVDAVFENLRAGGGGSVGGGGGGVLNGDDDGPRRDAAGVWLGVYDRHEAHYSELPGYVELRVSPRVDDDADAKRDRGDAQTDGDGLDQPDDAHEVAVAAHVHGMTVSMAGRSIGVLVRRNATASRLIARLRAMGVDASGEGGGKLTDDAAVLAVLAAMTLADHPGDTVSAYHVRHSPLGAIVGFTPENWQGIRTIHDVSRGIRVRLASEGYAEVLMDWVRQLAESCDARNMARLTQLVGLADRIDPLRLDRPSRFVAIVRGADVTEPSPSAVRVMTIHKSKGLEFDAVVLPELDGNLKKSKNGVQVNVVRAGATGPIEAVYRTTNKQTRALSATLQGAYEREQARQFKEDLCTLYVAMTRARYGLYLWVKPVGKKTLSMAGLLRDGLVDENAEGDGDADGLLYSEGDVEWYVSLGAGDASMERAEPVKPVVGVEPDDGSLLDVMSADEFVDLGGGAGRFGGIVRTLRGVSPSSLESGGAVMASSLLSMETGGGGGMVYGTAMHAALAKIEWYEDGVTGLPDGVDEGCMGGVLSRAVCDAGETVELWRERAFLVRDGDQLLSGVFDRVVLVRDADEPDVVRRVVLIDFKTEAVTDATIDDVVEGYRPQLQAYQRALMRMLKLDAGQIDVRLVFVGVGVVRDI